MYVCKVVDLWTSVLLAYKTKSYRVGLLWSASSFILFVLTFSCEYSRLTYWHPRVQERIMFITKELGNIARVFTSNILINKWNLTINATWMEIKRNLVLLSLFVIVTFYELVLTRSTIVYCKTCWHFIFKYSFEFGIELEDCRKYLIWIYLSSTLTQMIVKVLTFLNGENYVCWCYLMLSQKV